MSKSKQDKAGDAPNVSMSRSRVKPLGRVGLLKMEDIAPEQQHLYLEWHGRLYNKGGLSPEQLRKFDTPAVGTDGAPACAIQPFYIGGNVRILSNRASTSEP